jgi:hypothetical protein
MRMFMNEILHAGGKLLAHTARIGTGRYLHSHVYGDCKQGEVKQLCVIVTVTVTMHLRQQRLSICRKHT